MCCGGPFLAVDGSPREGNPLLSELSVDVRPSADVKLREKPRERSRGRSGWIVVKCCSEARVSANITVPDLDLGATVDDVWRCDAVAKRLLLFCGLELPVDATLCVRTARRRVATQTCSRRDRAALAVTRRSHLRARLADLFRTVLFQGDGTLRITRSPAPSKANVADSVESRLLLSCGRRACESFCWICTGSWCRRRDITDPRTGY